MPRMKNSLAVLGVLTLLVLSLVSPALGEIRWYVAPYDVTITDEGPLRTPAMARHIPTIPNAEGSRWDEAEILGSSILVKVDAPLARHAAIQADPDFFLIPSSGTVPTALRPAISVKLQSLGYTSAEITGTGWQISNLLTLLTSTIHTIVPNATGTGLIIGPGRRAPPKTVQDINARLPG